MQMFSIEYGEDRIEIPTPAHGEARGMQSPPPPVDGAIAIPEALARPIESDSLEEVAARKLQANVNAQAVIVVSDNTRPVPYRGESGLMVHIIRTLMQAGFSASHITVMIGAGSHRNMEGPEIEHMLGLQASGLGEVPVVNHEYEVDEQLVYLGETRKGSKVMLNRQYYEADLKIVTGLVESHFMAGASGGRKGICPGIVGKETLTIFHGGKFLNSATAADLVLEGNPLHDEALEVAKMAGCDFLVNATIDDQKRLNGVFAGDLIAAHQAAVDSIRPYVVVSLEQEYDIVLIPAGFVGVNHYQAGKAAIEAGRAVVEGGQVIVVSRHTDPDPIGGSGYKEAIRLLSELGHEQFLEKILDPNWKLIQEQWQVQMWGKVLAKIGGPDNLTYCALEIPKDHYATLPGYCGMSLLDEQELQSAAPGAMQKMVQRALDRAIARSSKENPSVLLLKDGPYGVPVVG